jgi:hypothetical protein
VKQYTVKTARNSDGRLGGCQRSAFANIGFRHLSDACYRWERICASARPHARSQTLNRKCRTSPS